MLRTTFAGLRLHKGRLVTTALAIALGVMFVAGTLVFTDTLRESFSTQVMGSAQKMDAIAQPEERSEKDIPADALSEVRDLPEIDRAAGVIKAPAPLLDPDGRAVGSTPTVGLSVGDVTRYSASEGKLPQAPGEVALATSTAETSGYKVGDTATVLDPDGDKHTFEITGLIDFGMSGEMSYRGAVAFTPETAAQMTGTDGFSEIDAIAAEGVPAEQAATAVSGAVPSGVDVLTGQELGEQLAENAGAEADIMATALMLFAMVSMLVAAIVISNTFSILVAQRQREMALLRCIGAVRGQVFRGVVAEALVVGLLSSALGVLAGIGLGAIGFALGSEALDAGGGASLVVSAQSVLIGMVIGTGTTLIAALLPARRATFVPPLAALRTSAVATGVGKRLGVVRVLVGLLFLLVSAGLVVLALNTDSGGQTEMFLVAGGGMTAFLGVVAVSPLLVRIAVASVAPLMRALGVSGALAADNTRRNPKRAATAMIALTVGATLITGYSVVNATMMSTTTDQLDEKFPIDYQVMGQFDEDDSGVPGQVAGDLRDSPAVKQVVAQRSTEVQTNSGSSFATTYQGVDLESAVSVEAKAGDIADVRAGSIAVHEDFAGNRGVGDTIRIRTEQGERTYDIAAVIGSDEMVSWGVLMGSNDFSTAFPGVDTDETLMITGAESAGTKELHDAVYAGVEEYPTLQVTSIAQMRAEYEDILGTAFLAIVAMLGLAVLIAVFGIANTLALSVLERTRESAMLRALGLKRGQLRIMLVLEAVLLCVIGALVGIVLGVVFGWAAAAAVFDELSFSAPVTQIAGFIAAAVAAGLLASVLPSRRAARTSITAALASE